MISYICLLATVFANLSCADDMDNSKFDNMIPYGKQEVSYTYPKGEGNLRVLTFNIRHCAGNDDVINYDRTAAVINGMEPDVVCLQEVDYMTTRSNKVDQLKTLADQSLTRVVNTVMAFCSKGRRSARRLIPFPVPNSVLLP